MVQFELKQKEKEYLLIKGKANMAAGGKQGLSTIDKPFIEPHDTRKVIAEKMGWSTGKIMPDYI